MVGSHGQGGHRNGCERRHRAGVREAVCSRGHQSSRRLSAQERAEQSYGRLDVGFNNAGILGEQGPTTGISLEGWNGTLKVNLTSAFLAAKHQIPAMLKQGKGSIIFTSTFVGYTVGFPGFVAYAASKSGLIGLRRPSPPNTGRRTFGSTLSSPARSRRRCTKPPMTPPRSGPISRTYMR